MQVKHKTYHWGIQWNCMVMQVKKVEFQRMGSLCIAQTYKDYTMINFLLNECYTSLHS